MQKLMQFFPKTKQKWSAYFKIFYPVVLGASLFALNGFIDNFMVGKYNGVAAVSAANSWTNIVIGLVIGVGVAGGVVSAQLFFSNKHHDLLKMSKFRYILTFFLVAIIAILALLIPTNLNQLFLKTPTDINEHNLYIKNLEMANNYLRITVLQWIIFAISGNLGNQLREIGHGKITMYWGVASILTNIILNATLIYGFDLGVEGAAWASVASRVVELLIGIIYLRLKKLPLSFRIYQVFQFDLITIKLFFKQFILFFSYSSMIGIVTFRNYFYDWGYPQGSIGPGIGALAVLGLTNAIMNVFTTVFAAIGVMSANFVGSELSNYNITQAKSNSQELKGFNTLMAIFLSLVIVVISFLIPLMSFLVNSNQVGINTKIQLNEVKKTLFVLALFYPLWIWFTTTYRNGVAGGKSFWFSIGDWVINVLQIGWVAIVMGPLKDNWLLLQNNFWLAYIIFFLSDIVKLIWQEICYYAIDWAVPIEKKWSVLNLSTDLSQ